MRGALWFLLGSYAGYRLSVWMRRRLLLRAVRRAVAENTEWRQDEIRTHRSQSSGLVCPDYEFKMVSFPVATGTELGQFVDETLPKS